MKQLIEKLRYGFAVYATGGENMPASIKMDNDAAQLRECRALLGDALQESTDRATEISALKDMMDKALYALEYASDMTKPEGLGGCDCPICVTIFQINEMKAGVK